MSVPRAHRFLLATDETEATDRAVDYLGRMLRGTGEFSIVLAHLLAPLPQELLEHGGSSDAQEEERIEADQEERQLRQTKMASEATKPMFDRARNALQVLGVPADAVETRCVETIPEDRAADFLIREARALNCGTIVVGRNSLPRLREVFHRHMATDVVKKADGFSVLIVE